MEERARSCLLRSRANLVADIKAPYLMDHMISDAVLTTDEEDLVLSKATRREQACALLEMVLGKDNRAFVSFYNALVRESYVDLARLLQPDLPLVSHDDHKGSTKTVPSIVQQVLSEGGVPQRPMVCVSRPALLNQLRSKLYNLQAGPGWVVLYGMAGSGKSVLAAEAVRDHVLLTECFPNGVHWVSVGQMDRSDLLVRLQSLCFRLEQSQSPESCHRPPCSLEEAKERLRFLMLRKHPRSLLILDDVWEVSILKAFDVQTRVLITTRDRSLVHAVSGQQHEVAVDGGLGEDKALEVLALYVNMTPLRLPEQARSIVKECKGSPLVVSLIGALLRDFPDRWDYYLRQLQARQFRRIRKSSSYDYEALDQAMNASLQMLPDTHRQLYTHLAVIEKDVKVPAKVLCVLWDLELEEVEDILLEFVNKSLLFRDWNQRPYCYYLHDLQLDFLHELNRTRLPELHTKMVRQYQRYYKTDIPACGDTESLYWLRFLTYHMAKAGLAKELYSLMFSLDWVSTKARVMGPAPLINDYVDYASILDEENVEVRGHFQEFLSLNGHQLDQRPFPDVLQLGLSQPHSSEVYRQARHRAQQQAQHGALYLDWINNNSSERLCRLVLQPHQGVVYYSCFNQDGSKIASCGASKTVRVCKSTSGEKLLEFQVADEEVVCVAFSPDDRLLATCSSDRKIQIWNAELGTLIRAFEGEYDEQINHCQFTNHRHRLLLATCSNDKYTNTKLWNLNKATSQNTMFGHTEAVHHCCFSPDDHYLATSSSDGTLKMFEVASANEWKTINVKEQFPEAEQDTDVMVTCSTWSPDARHIICAARNAVFMFDVASGDQVCEIRTSRLSTVQFLHACPKSQLLAIALSHYTLELWDLEAIKKVAECSGHLSWVRCVQFSNDGTQLLSCSDDHTIRLWETNKVHTSSAVSLKRDFDVLFTNGDITMVAPDNRNRVQVRCGPAGAVVFESEEQESRIRSTCICPQPSAVALGREDGAIKVLEVPSGINLATLLGHSKTVFHCLFSEDGQHLITSSEDSTIRVWRWQTGECVILAGHTESVRRFSILPPSSSSSSCSLLSWSFDGTVKVWDMITGERLQDISGHHGAILSCDFSSDGQRFATTSADQTAKVWSIASWELIFTLNGHKDCVRSCQFSHDNCRLATGDDNGEIRLWNMLDGTLLKICSRGDKDAMDSQHGGWVTDLHFSPDNKTLVSTGGYIKWWNVEKGEELQTFFPTGSNLKRLHVSPDFSTFVTIDSIGILYILKKVMPISK